MFGDLVRSRRISYSAGFIGLIALGSWISIPFAPVPLTLQTLFVLLAGAIMHRHAVIPVSLYVFLGTLGLPVFHNGTAGLGVLLGPTGGFLIGFIPAACATGLAYEQPHPVIHILGLALGTVLIYLSGTAWIVYSTGITPNYAIILGVLPFIPGDAAKAGIVYQIAQRIP